MDLSLHTQETKKQSKQWTESGQPTLKKTKIIPSVEKMATVFWDVRGIIFVDYLEKEKTITDKYYVDLLQRLNDEIKVKWPYLTQENVLFHQDNTLAYTSTAAIVKIYELSFELLLYPLYLSDIAAYDFKLFPNLKKMTRRKKIFKQQCGHRCRKWLFSVKSSKNRSTKMVKLLSKSVGQIVSK